MAHFKLAFIGFGNVGKALARLLLHKQVEIDRLYGLTFSTTGIATGRHGCAINPQGIDLAEALSLLEADRPLQELSKTPGIEEARDFLQLCEADVLFENTPVNYASGQPALDHLRMALDLGMHAITANKGPVVHGYAQLSKLASAKGRKFLFESTVMDGAPIFSLFRNALPAARLRAFRGILNSTTNLILGRMEAGESFDQAVAYAQTIGIAETDPSGDIDGWDAAIKVAALITVLMETPFTPQQVERRGIRGITPEMIESARAQGKRYKLVCSAERDGERLKASVGPELVDSSSPLYGMMDSSTGVTFRTDVLPDYSISVSEREGMSGGPQETAYGLFADFVSVIAR